MLRLKLRCGGATALVAFPSDGSAAALAAAAADAFKVPAARVTLFTGHPPAPLVAPVRDGSLVDVRVSAPPPPMTRHAVAADNSCLFASVARAVRTARSPAELRAAAAAAVLADGATWSAAVLGREPAAYAAHIVQPASWGGAIELAIFAAEFRTEFAAVEIRSGTVYVFGEGAGFARRAYLVFDGLHYDPLERGDARVFDVGDAAARDAAVAFAADMRRRHQFTDLENFTLRCGDCATGLTGEAAAQAHARETGHTNFQEFAPAAAAAAATPTAAAAAAATEWACAACTLINGAADGACGACGGKRP